MGFRLGPFKMVIYSKFNSLGDQKITGTLFGILAIVSFPIILLYPYGLDDLQAFSAIQSRSYLDLALGSHGWGGTAFYRPLIDLQTKLIWDVFAGNFFAFKLYQFLLFVLFLLTLNKLVEQLRLNLLGTALLLGMLVSSRAIHDAFLWWVNMGQAMVLVCFSLVLNFLLAWQSHGSAYKADSGLLRAFIYAGLSFLALFSKEVGLVVLIGFAYLAYFERNRLATVLLIIVFAAFVLARIYVIGGIEGRDAFMASSGLGFSFLSSEELRDAFGGNKYFFYLYNMVSQFLYVLFRQPVDGQFVSYSFGLRGLATVAYALASGYILMLLLLGKVRLNGKILTVLIGAIVINSLLSFPYARERIMVAADLAAALLFALIATSLSSVLINKKNDIRSAASFNVGLVGIQFILLISSLRGARKYLGDFSDAIISMRQFTAGDYRLLTESDSPLPDTVLPYISEALNLHYAFLLELVEMLSK